MKYNNDYNWNLGTDFEQAMRDEICRKFNIESANLRKPDYIDVETITFYECKYTRPFYQTAKCEIGEDIGSGLPSGQFEAYAKLVINGKGIIKVVFVHGFREGVYKGEVLKRGNRYRYQGKVFYTELTLEMIDKAVKSPNGQTVWWPYEALGGFTPGPIAQVKVKKILAQKARKTKRQNLIGKTFPLFKQLTH